MECNASERIQNLLEEQFYSDTVESLKSRALKEYEYKDKLKSLTEEKLRELNEFYHRDLEIQYSKRKLLPPSPKLHNKLCLRYLDQPYNASLSIIIVFNNELSPLLMRTLTTIVHRTLPRYLTEIIVIDDGSDVDISEEVMEYSTTQRIPVKWLKNDYNIGIARSRMKGIEMALGDTIALLDSHMEIADLWLEPLLDIISSKPLAVAIPHIMMADEKQYDLHDNIEVRGRFVTSISHGYGMIVVNNVGDKRPEFPWQHYPSSALLGGGIVALKETLLRFYPQPVFESCKWGVENNRLSFRSWMCGEGVWMNDCSTVLHAGGSDPHLYRYIHSDPDYIRKIVAESVAELLNFCKDPVKHSKMMKMVSNDPEYLDLILKTSDEIRETQFDPTAMKCHSNYTWWFKHIHEHYITWDSDQFRTLPRYLTEIIVIDDGSEVDISEEVMEYSATQRIPVKWLKNDYNIGIARSRMKGIEMALGDTIALLDSHMEIADLWLEPLLDIISSKPLAVAIPHIMMADEKQYDLHDNIEVRGRFVTSISHGYGMIVVIVVNNVGDKRPEFPWQHYPSSALLGGGIVALKETLLRFYPQPVFESCKWGVENNRLSFRSWMCGEGVWMNDCSTVLHAGGSDPHLYRYIHSDPDYIRKIVAESVAELLNFCKDPVKHSKMMKMVSNDPEYLDLILKTSDEIRETQFDPTAMQCHSNYTWWFKNIHEHYITWDSDQFRFVGEIASVGSDNICLDSPDLISIVAYPCRIEPLTVQNNHMFGFSKSGALMAVGDNCFDTYHREEGESPGIYSCHNTDPEHGVITGSQQFEYNEQKQWIRNADTDRCLTLVKDEQFGKLGMWRCDRNRVDQKWTIKLVPWWSTND
eukprot:sb/3461980/